MKNTVFTGVATAIVPSLTEKGIDYENFAKLIEWQINEGVDAIVDTGTMGEGSCALQLKLLPLINTLFCEVNPIPVKAAVSAMGFGENYFRLPLTPMEPKNEEKPLSLMREAGLSV